MHYLIDGYNLAHWLAAGRDLSPEELRRLLLERLAGRVPKDAESVRIFWDVSSRDPSIPVNAYLDWCTMHNVPDADAAIIDAVYDAASPRTQMVVSRDREVTGKSRQLGARTMSPVQLLGRG